MHRVLLILSTASYRAGAFLEAAAGLGVSVVVATEREQALALRNPSGHLTLAGGDVAGAVAKAREFHARAPLSAVLGADDDGIVLAAEIAAALGLRHAAPDAVRRARDKRLMRVALEQAGVPGPWFESFAADLDPRRVARRVRYPCVIKPPALSGSRGVVRANEPGEFAWAFERVAKLLRSTEPRAALEILVEGYVPGVEVAVEGLVTDGCLRVVAVFDKPDPLTGPTFEETIYVTPSRLPAEALRAIQCRVGEVIRALGLTQGPVHAELRINAEGVWPIEIAPRSIGGLCSRSLRSGTGASLEQLILRHALGEPTDDWTREPAASGVMMIPIPRAGVLRAVGGLDRARAVEGIDEVRITAARGRPLMPLPEGDRYLGFLFARAAEPRTVEQALRSAHRLLEFEIEAPAGERED